MESLAESSAWIPPNRAKLSGFGTSLVSIRQTQKQGGTREAKLPRQDDLLSIALDKNFRPLLAHGGHQHDHQHDQR
jgi:hypothetical protein